MVKSFWSLVIFIFVLASFTESKSSYDFIVVGSGAGGGAVARRLAENGKFKVLVIEAGGVPKPGQEVPAYTDNFLGDSDVTFNYKTVPQQNSALYSNGTLSVIAGRVLGGTTSINYMWFNRGHPRDYDNWALVTGDDSWKYANMLKYFKRAETYKGEFPSDQHGYDGPVTVSQPHYSPGLDYWYAAAKELGYPIGDPNGPQKLGFHPVEFAKRFGRRDSSYMAYLNPILNHRNLRILTNTTATQIIFKGNKAVGVRFISNSTKYKFAHAAKEVIICAGTYGSPLLLQRSGIGPKEVLAAANIPILKELPVGLNLQDHAAVNLNFIINNASVVLDADRDLNQQTRQLYDVYGDGPFSSGRGATGQAMISTSVTKGEGKPDWPDAQLCMSHSTEPYLGAYDLHNTVNVPVGETQMSSSIFLGRPKSRGSIRINPTDPVFGNPILNIGHLTNVRDLQMFLDSIVETLKIYEHTKAYKSLAARYAPIDLPDCRQYPVKSKEYWICYVQQTIQGGCHPAGTNKMGRATDPSAVVDSELKVIGIEDLRVVDASIMPFITNANPHAAVYGIAEKAADMILKRWGSSVGKIQGGDFLGNSLNGGGLGVQPFGTSLKQPPFQHQPKSKQHFQQWPNFQQWSNFQHGPDFQHWTSFQQQLPQNQHHTQSNVKLADKSNYLPNVVGFVSHGSSKFTHGHFDVHEHETFFIHR